ncbi:MAG: AEC family transporter [Betaproteobacteria bacterium]|jgi:hypothetical protein|nr:AEC family transporter [Betaproteobacteria bacterium]
MNGFSLLFPDFAMIVAGAIIMHSGWIGRSFWEGAERLVYFVLFPALLFAAVTRTPLASGQTTLMVQAATVGVLVAAALGTLTRWIPGMTRMDWASGIQCAFRFNTYIAFAIASRAWGGEGLAMMAVIVGFAVPLANVMAVSFLANTLHPGRLIAELLRNPLLIATLAGVICNLLGLIPPELIYGVLDRASSAAISIGLMCVGAGLSFAGMKSTAARWQGVCITAIKLLITPPVVWAACKWMGIEGLQRDIAILFATMPTASSAYILAVRMGGNGPLTAGLVSISTLASMVTITLWVTVLQSLG